MVNNSFIAKKLKLAARLMELHGENDFKVKAYHKSIEAIKTLDAELATMTVGELTKLDGIGKSTAEKIVAIANTQTFDQLQSLVEQTPEGVIEMLDLPGFGAKKIRVLWQDAGATSLDELLVLCQQGKIASVKGFAEKTQESLLRAVEFKLSCRGWFRYATIEPVFQELVAQLRAALPQAQVSETGALRRRMDVIDRVDLLVGFDGSLAIKNAIKGLEELEEHARHSGPFAWVGVHKSTGVKVKVRWCKQGEFEKTLLLTTGSVQHLYQRMESGLKLREAVVSSAETTEADIYKSIGLQYIAPEMREGIFELTRAANHELPELVEMTDLKGILHNHSTYSDGRHTLRQMAEHCKALGYEYLGISDHSQTAVYANGLYPNRVKDQQEEIRQLNEELAPFRIFSGIESDILSDGSLDYTDDVLESFDFIVSSVHSGLSMDINKATDRLLTAVRNPHTTILGHMTGRLLLEREGYPVDHKEIIDACAENGVVIEINASPYRLDIDWRWVNYALEKGVMLSINPDAHAMEGYKDMYYGLLAGRKGGLTKAMTFNALSLKEMEAYLSQRKAKINA